jgi:hypothetical protein
MIAFDDMKISDCGELLRLCPVAVTGIKGAWSAGRHA